MRHDPAAHIAALKVELGITAAQEPAWAAYAGTVRPAMEKMHAAHMAMHEKAETMTLRNPITANIWRGNDKIPPIPMPPNIHTAKALSHIASPSRKQPPARARSLPSW